MQQSSRIRVVLLDLGHVVLELNFPRFLSCLGVERFESESGKLTHALDNWEIYDQFERGKLSPLEFKRALESHIQRTFTDTEFDSAWNAIFEKPVMGMEPLLQALSLEVPIFALTNSNIIHVSYAMTHFSIMNCFRQVFTSYELGARKPEREIYEAVLNSLKCDPSAVLFVDDQPKNVEGAKQLGMHAEYCRNSAEQLRQILQKHRLLL